MPLLTRLAAHLRASSRNKDLLGENGSQEAVLFCALESRLFYRS